MPTPNFFVIGAGRSGTTSLHNYLRQHPEVFVPMVKSPSYYFCRDQPAHNDPYIERITHQYFVRERERYMALFDDAHGFRAIGEVSPAYLNATYVARNIAEDVPHARLIAIIRNPIERVWSRYTARRRDGLEPHRSMQEIIEEESRLPLERDIGYGTYLSGACCAPSLNSFLKVFPRSQLQIHRFETLQTDPQKLLSDIFKFLGVDQTYAIDTSKRYNQSTRSPSNRTLGRLWTQSSLWRAGLRSYLPKKWRDTVFDAVMRTTSAQPIPPSIAAQLSVLFADEIDALESILGWDLKQWRSLR